MAPAACRRRLSGVWRGAHPQWSRRRGGLAAPGRWCARITSFQVAMPVPPCRRQLPWPTPAAVTRFGPAPVPVPRLREPPAGG